MRRYDETSGKRSSRARRASRNAAPERKAAELQPKSACACGGGCPRCTGEALPGAIRSQFEAAHGADLSGVRVHPDAADVTAPLGARAVTRGQDIYFHPGQFAPETAKGQALIAHELAHTLQTRESENAGEAGVARADSRYERNADALARGETTRVLAAPAGAALASPFDQESGDERARRQQLLQSINNAADTLLRLLRTGGLLQNTEVAVTRGGVRGVVCDPSTVGTPSEVFVSYAARDARVRRIIRSLMAMGTLYRGAPIPAAFSAPTLTAPGQYQSTVTYPPGSPISTSSYGGGTAEWADLQAAYERYRITQGQTGPPFDSDWYYLDPSATVVPGAARGAPRIGGGIQTGVYMVVPDIDGEPLRYWRLTGSSPVPEGATVIELWHDDFGYYYTHGGQRIDVPSPWSP
jgi:uncharacterized protein DUF4157